MTKSDLDKVAEKLPLSRSTLAANGMADITPIISAPTQTGDHYAPPTPGKRIRQSAKPRLNKLETQWRDWMLATYRADEITSQAIRLELGNGIWYKPDFVTFYDGSIRVYEVKGPHTFRGGLENLKVAASKFPMMHFCLVWKERGQWKSQEVLP